MYVYGCFVISGNTCNIEATQDLRGRMNGTSEELALLQVIREEKPAEEKRSSIGKGYEAGKPFHLSLLMINQTAFYYGMA